MCKCSCTGSNIDLSLLKPTLDKYSAVKGSLITILQSAQDIYGYLPTEVIYEVAKATGNTPAKVMGVATFYTQFRFKPVGKNLILLCQGTACHVNGSEMIAQTIKDELGISDGETTEDGLFTLSCVACLGCCSLSPVMMINDETYGSLTSRKVREIIASIKSQNN